MVARPCQRQLEEHCRSPLLRPHRGIEQRDKCSELQYWWKAGVLQLDSLAPSPWLQCSIQTLPESKHPISSVREISALMALVTNLQDRIIAATPHRGATCH